MAANFCSLPCKDVEAKERAAKLWAEMKNSSVTPQLPDSKAMAPHPQEKTVTEICNFAGQAVVVTKTVSVSNVPTKKPTIPGKEPVQKLPQKTGAAVSLPTKRHPTTPAFLIMPLGLLL